jgi:hypothetical protein
MKLTQILRLFRDAVDPDEPVTKRQLDAVSAGGGHTIQDEGVDLPAQTRLNFQGAGVAVTDDATNGQTDVAIPGDAVSSVDGRTGAVTLTDLYASLGRFEFQASECTTQIPPGGAATKLTFASEVYDSGNVWDAANNRFVAPRAGRYWLEGQAYVTGNVDGNNLILQLRVNPGTAQSVNHIIGGVHSAHTRALVVTGGKLLGLAAGDVVEIYGIYFSASTDAAVNCAGGTTTYFNGFLAGEGA